MIVGPCQSTLDFADCSSSPIRFSRVLCMLSLLWVQSLLQQVRYRSSDNDLTVVQYILNKALIENQLLKISGKKLFDFSMECVLIGEKDSSGK